MTDLLAREAALEPLLAALVARAKEAAEAARAAAEEDGRRAVAAARDQSATLLADARAHGEADAAALLQVERARARRVARAVVLQAQRAVYTELREQARQAARQLLADPTRRERLIAVLRRQLGEQAAIREQPEGGIIAETRDGRSIDASVATLIDQAVADLDLEQLWAAS